MSAESDKLSATISLSGRGLEDFFSADYFFQLMSKLGLFFHTPFEAKWVFFHKESQKVSVLKSSHAW